MNNQKIQDMQMGEKNEVLIFDIIKNHFDLDNLIKTSPSHTFDFVSDDIYFEVKSRRCNKDTYSDTMVGYNKIRWLKSNKVSKAYFIFMFLDGNYFYEYDDKVDLNVREGGRWDRGRVEKKMYYYIPTNLLEKII